jgi:hypothetical protein
VTLVPDSASGKGNTSAKKRISQILVAFGVLALLQYPIPLAILFFALVFPLPLAYPGLKSRAQADRPLTNLT